jgi:hypothetical protein
MYAGMQNTAPAQMPKNCERNWCRGLLPSTYPPLRSVSRSAECMAAPAVTEAVMRFVWMLPAARPPYMNWVIFPSAPMGVMLVSPVARPATMLNRADMITARRPIHQAMSNSAQARTTVTTVVTSRPRVNHAVGTSTSAMPPAF